MIDLAIIFTFEMIPFWKSIYEFSCSNEFKFWKSTIRSKNQIEKKAYKKNVPWKSPEGNKTRHRILTFPPIVTPLQFSVARFVPFGRLPWDIFFISFLSNIILRSKYDGSSWKSIRMIENIFIEKSNFPFSILFICLVHFRSLNRQ